MSEIKVIEEEEVKDAIDTIKAKREKIDEASIILSLIDCLDPTLKEVTLNNQQVLELRKYLAVYVNKKILGGYW